MKVFVYTIRGTAPDTKSIFLPQNVLTELGWREGDALYLEPVADKDGKSVHVILEKRDV